MPDSCPSRRALRDYLFHAARWMIGRDNLCLDPLTVSIECSRQQEFVRLESVEREGEFLPTIVGTCPTTTYAEVLWSGALSHDEKTIVRIIAERGPIPTKLVFRESGLAKTRGALLVANLRERGVLRPDPDGYVITHTVWHLISVQQDANNLGA